MSQSIVEVNSYTYAGPQPGFLREAEVCPSNALIAVEAGKFEFGVGNLSGYASFGDLVFCPSGTILSRRSFGEITFHYFLFDSYIESDYAITDIPVGKVSVNDVNRLSSTFSHLQQIWREYRRVPRINGLINHMLSDILILCELERKRMFEKKITSDPLMQTAVSHIHKHLFGELSIQDISKQLGIKPSELTRRFRMAYHVTPISYVTQRRLEEAKRLLLETDETLDSIASRCGYESGSYLCRVFHAKIGITPSDFKKKHQI